MSWSFGKRFTGTAHTSSKRSALTHNVTPPGIAAARKALGWVPENLPVEARPIVAIPVDWGNSSSSSSSCGPQPAASFAGARDVGIAPSLPFGCSSAPSEVCDMVGEGGAAAAPCTPRPNRRRAMGPLVPSTCKRAKGSLGEALRIASSHSTRHEAMVEYSESVYAPQTVASKAAMRNTWSSVAEKLGSRPLPVTVELVHQVASALKAAGYRAAAAYVNEALQWHKREGYPVSDALELAVRDAKRAVTRALGPKRRAAEVKIHWFEILLTTPEVYQLQSWPNHRRLAWILGYHFLLREAELSCLFLEDVTLNLELKQISLHLPVSKTDPAGRGCRRTLRCECAQGFVVTCAFCNGLKLVTQQQGALGALGIAKDQWAQYPLIGRVDNPRQVVSKADVVDALRWDAGFLRESLPEAAELEPQEVSGHSLRRSGCKGLARLGVPLELIQFMSRHSSQAVLDYVEEAMEECPNLQFKMQEHLELRDQVSLLVSKTNSLEQGLAEVKRHFEQVANHWQFPLDREAVLKLFDMWARPKVIANMASKKLHSAATNNFRLAPSEWITDCGWKWTLAGRTAKACVEFADVPFDFMACDKCKPRLPAWATDLDMS